MPKLKTVIEVEPDAIVRHLLEQVQEQLHGPEFSCGDVVVFTAQVEPGGAIDDEGVDHEGYVPDAVAQVLKPGAPAVVRRYHKGLRGEPTYYEVLCVDSDGETFKYACGPSQIARRSEPFGAGPAGGH